MGNGQFLVIVSCAEGNPDFDGIESIVRSMRVIICTEFQD